MSELFDVPARWYTFDLWHHEQYRDITVQMIPFSRTHQCVIITHKKALENEN